MANASADMVSDKGSYAELWISQCSTSQALADAINAAVQNLRQAIQACCLAIADGLQRVEDRINASVQRIIDGMKESGAV